MIKTLVTSGILMVASMSAFAQTTAPTAPAAPPAAVLPASGTWKVTGDVQGVSVAMTCLLTLGADQTITGNCTDNAGSSTAPHPVTGTVKDHTLSWSFNSDYQGSPITVGLTGTVDATGGKMAGTIAVDPMSADGDFTAVLQVAA
jgi:hypothetical protein